MEPVLVIMAAGMGSRYGGMKQIDPVDDRGHIIMDFSIYDAIRAGFKNVVFIIKPEIEEEFKKVIGNRISKKVNVQYVFQKIDYLPEGYQVPAGRVKPWGTGHAVLSCSGVVKGPFAVINADDYYGVTAYKAIYNFLTTTQEDQSRYAMVGYQLENTLTEHGHVARGVCEITEDGYLKDICERTRIEQYESGARYTEDEGKTWVTIPKDSIVSMNMWGFSSSILKELEVRFENFLSKEARQNPLKAEYFLPMVVGEIIREEKATVEVLKSEDKWYGVTYKEDKEAVVIAIAKLKEQGLYPQEF
ncbi:MAG: sugar phosphate nucleotidyltransferase [Mobilitalea sp.]